MAHVGGWECELWYAVGGQGGSWIEATNVKDLNTPFDKDMIDATTRACAGWKESVCGLKNLEVTWDMVWDSEDAFFAAVIEAYLDNLMLGLRVLDGTDGQGPQADFYISKCERKEPVAGLVEASVTATKARSDTGLTWVT